MTLCFYLVTPSPSPIASSSDNPGKSVSFLLLSNSRFALCRHFTTTTRTILANSLSNSNFKSLGD